eukprot:1153376-Pyramimonas_sp.AAC.1
MSYSPVAEVRVARLSKRHCYKLPRCKGLNIGETNRFVPVGAGNPKPCEHVTNQVNDQSDISNSDASYCIQTFVPFKNGIS